MIVTKPELSEMIIRQFNLTNIQRKHIAYQLSLLNDKEIMREASDSGLTVHRLRAGMFTLNELR